MSEQFVSVGEKTPPVKQLVGFGGVGRSDEAAYSRTARTFSTGLSLSGSRLKFTRMKTPSEGPPVPTAVRPLVRTQSISLTRYTFASTPQLPSTAPELSKSHWVADSVAPAK